MPFLAKLKSLVRKAHISRIRISSRPRFYHVVELILQSRNIPAMGPLDKPKMTSRKRFMHLFTTLSWYQKTIYSFVIFKVCLSIRNIASDGCVNLERYPWFNGCNLSNRSASPYVSILLQFSRSSLIIHLRSANVPKGVLNVYWNQGGKAIDDFFEEHRSACKDNWICRRLKLRDSDGLTAPQTSRFNTKTRVSFLLRE